MWLGVCRGEGLEVLCRVRGAYLLSLRSVGWLCARCDKDLSGVGAVEVCRGKGLECVEVV
jgi:hypothetical protein